MNNPHDQIVIRHPSSTDEQRIIVHLEEQKFKEYYTKKNVSHSLWLNYNHLTFISFLNNEIQGYVQFWPLKKSTYLDLIDHKLSEVDLTCENIENAKTTQCQYWFVGSVVFTTRKTKLIPKLIELTIQEWCKNLKPGLNINICGLIIKENSFTEKILKLLDFKIHKKYNNGKNKIYTCTTTPENLSKNIKYLVVQIDRQAIPS